MTYVLTAERNIADDDWKSCNDRGIQFAIARQWADAAQQFELARALVGDAADAGNDAVALLLGNATTALFNAGRTDAAFRTAVANVGLRMDLWGATSLATLRSKSDLATIQCALGRYDEARELIGEIVSALECEEGPDSRHLIVVIENAARIAIAAGDVAAAEPQLLRLFSLLNSNGVSTTDAEHLLKFVAAARDGAVVDTSSGTETVMATPTSAAAAIASATATPTPTTVVVASTESVGKPAAECDEDTAGESVVYPAGESVEITAEESVAYAAGEAVEDVAVESLAYAAGESVGDPAGESVEDAAQKAPDAAPVGATVPGAARLSPFDELELVTPPDGADSHAPVTTAAFSSPEIVEPAPPTLNEVPENRRHVHRDDDSLGFLVQHGTTVTPDDPIDVLGGPIGPLPRLARPVELPVRQESTEEPATAPPTPPGRIMPLRRASRDVPVVVPTPVRTGSLSPGGRTQGDSVRGGNALQMPAPPSVMEANKSVLLDRQRVRASGGARVWLVVGGGLAAVAAAVAWFVVQNTR